MGFFSIFSKKVEAINKGKVAPESLSEEFSVDEVELLQDEAKEKWLNMAQTIIVNVVKANHQSIERAFIFINFDESAPTFDIFYQEQRKIIFWMNRRIKSVASKSSSSYSRSR